MTDVVVRDTGVRGKGVFAARDFEAGEVVLEWENSKKISFEEFQQLPENEKKYVSKIKDVLVWFGVPERYVKPSSDPNTKAEIGKGVAVKSIKVGEEITADFFKEPPKF